MTYLDTRCNPLKAAFSSGAKGVCKAAQIVQDVDWRLTKGPRPCSTPSRLLGCLTQQAGEKAPDGEACSHCKDSKGPFASCRILAVDSRIMFDGACGNCGFNSTGIRCSLREGNGLVKWAREYVAKTNPYHRLAKDQTGTPVSKRIRSPKDGKEKEKKKNKEKDSNGGSSTKGKGKGKAKFYENEWLKNPLNDPAVYSTKTFGPAGSAFEAIPKMIEALTEAREILKEWLVEHDQLDKSESSSSEEESNPFLARKRKRTGRNDW